MLGIIGRSNTPIPANEITRQMKKHGGYYKASDRKYVYEVVENLTPIDDEIPGIRLFCYNDLIEEFRSKDTITSKKIRRGLWVYFKVELE